MAEQDQIKEGNDMEHAQVLSKPLQCKENIHATIKFMVGCSWKILQLNGEIDRRRERRSEEKRYLALSVES